MNISKHPFVIKSVKSDGFFCGYASVFNVVDQDNDVILPGAFENSLKLWTNLGQLPKMLWQHDIKTPIGVWHEIFEDKHGLYVRGQLLLNTKLGKTAFNLLQAGAVNGLSVGFRNKRSTINRKLQQRNIHEAELFEVSIVTFAANPAARVLHVGHSKSFLIPTLQKLIHQIKS